MKAFIRFFSLPSFERVVILRLLFHIVRAESILRFMSYAKAQKLAFGRSSLRAPVPLEPVRILQKHLKLLGMLCRNLPRRPTCLKLAVALRDSLADDGVEAVVKIGVCRFKSKLEAHAWIECCGFEVLKNGPYSQLTTITGVDIHERF